MAFLKDRVLDDVSRTIPSAKNNPPVDLILWVITVPAIWDDKAKRFMREAAEQVAIKDNFIPMWVGWGYEDMDRHPVLLCVTLCIFL